jgi:acetyl esterase/lipase
LVALLFAAFVVPSGEAASADGAERIEPSMMNLLFVIIEDCNAGAWSSYGNPICKTPNMDRFARTAVQFNSAYVQAVACNPSRTSFRNRRYSYMEFKGGPEPVALYDLAKDPWETVNLANDPAHAETRTKMAALLQAGWQAARPKLPAPPPAADTARVTAKRPFDKVAVFKKTPQGDLRAHIHFPPGWSATDRRPAIVFWVGGGFRSGGVGQFNARAEYFAGRGLVTICAEYRGRDSHGILLDSCAEDARSAMRWVKGHASELGIAPDKVIASGGSAGGCLSLLVAREEGPNAQGEDLTISMRPCALVLFNPAVGDGVMQTIGWGGPAQAAVNAQVAALNTPQQNEPPAIMFFGTEDRFLKVAREFRQKSAAQGTRCEVWVADKMEHGFFNRQPWHDATTLLADEFLVSLGYLKGAPTVREDPTAVLTLDK